MLELLVYLAWWSVLTPGKIMGPARLLYQIIWLILLRSRVTRMRERLVLKTLWTTAIHQLLVLQARVQIKLSDIVSAIASVLSISSLEVSNDVALWFHQHFNIHILTCILTQDSGFLLTVFEYLYFDMHLAFPFYDFYIFFKICFS